MKYETKLKVLFLIVGLILFISLSLFVGKAIRIDINRQIEKCNILEFKGFTIEHKTILKDCYVLTDQGFVYYSRVYEATRALEPKPVFNAR